MTPYQKLKNLCNKLIDDSNSTNNASEKGHYTHKYQFIWCNASPR